MTVGLLFAVGGIVAVAIYAVRTASREKQQALAAVMECNRMMRTVTLRQHRALLGYSADQRQLIFEREQTERAELALRAAADKATASRRVRTDEAWIGGEPEDNGDAEVARMNGRNTGL